MPQEALDGSSIELTGGVPRFRYTNFVGSGCVVPAEGITEERLSDYELYIARNEIFARHGRTFANDDLANHFAQQSWYEPTVSPEAFDEDALNAVEKKNALTIRSVEERRGFAYL
ncbi:YARHG domain-containing protein [Slackia piriformis]